MPSNSSLKDMKLGEYLERKNQRIGENLEQIEQRTSAKKSAIFVCRFAPHLNEWHIRQLFSHCGTITSVTELPKAFRIEFVEKRMAAFAIWSMNDKYWPNTFKKIICDWWNWKNNKTNQAQAGPLNPEKQSMHAPVGSIPLTVQKVAPKLTDDERQKESSITKGEILILPMTNQSVLPLPTPPFDLSTEECEDANDKRTEAAKLAEEFATKNLTLQERMEAILKMISGRSGEEGAEEEEEEEK
ncbi:hypothetical protein niasHT_030360 [Heterodera trifolii]|uniref:RRM domain-containing protein n=3 Tax=Heterodera TaxID=34509 RepID=A0ABD2JNE1_9BILA